MSLGDEIPMTRIERGWSQSRLADNARVSRPTVARLELGEDESTATLAKVATALGLTVALTRQGRTTMSVVPDTISPVEIDLGDTQLSGEAILAKRAFISFDYDNDARLKDLLVGQAKNPDTPFEIADWSIKTASPTWKIEARRRIKAAGLVIVLCGQNTHTAVGVAEELRIARDEGVPYFLLAGYKTGSMKPTTTTTSDKLYNWTWDNLKALVGGAR